MTKRLVPLAVAAWLAACAASWAFDTVKLIDGKQVVGDITKMSALEVVVDQQGVPKSVPVNEIEVIYYQDEPTLLRVSARSAVNSSNYPDGLTALQKIKPEEMTRKLIKQDVDFYTALCTARLALEGTGTIIDAGRTMKQFIDNNNDNYHYWEACEVMADLSVAIQSYTSAQTYYGLIAQAPWPDYKMRASAGMGWAQLAEGKPADALKSFQTVLDSQVQGEGAERQKLSATVGKARCLTEAGQPDEAIKLVDTVLSRSDLAEQIELQARAYNALGAAHRKAGRVKEALLAFLHTDILYFGSAKAHIEALETSWSCGTRCRSRSGPRPPPRSSGTNTTGPRPPRKGAAGRDEGFSAASVCTPPRNSVN